jgi:predicted ribonuclease toxin of YeeF-YezG toxin-antitoxin module
MGRLLRISIYACFIIVLYYLITDMLKSNLGKQKSQNSEELNQTKIPEAELPDSLDTDLTLDTTLITNDDIVDGIIDYNDIDKKVDALLNDKKNTTPSNQNNEKIKVEKPVKKVEEEKKNPKPATKVTADNFTINTGNGGSFMVICGSYLLKENADKMVQKLKKMGYSNARVTIFDASEYHSAIAGHYASQGDAQKTASSLKQKGIDCFVRSK